MKKIIKVSILLFIISIFSYASSLYFGKFYNFLYPSSSFASVDFTYLIGLPLGYIFFVIITFIVFGDSKKYWWIGVLLVPALVFEVYFDWEHIYIPIVIGTIGWALGFGISRIKQEFYRR